MDGHRRFLDRTEAGRQLAVLSPAGPEPEQVGKPMQYRQHDHEQEDDQPQQSSWGEEPQQRAHRVGQSLGPIGRPPAPSQQRA